MSIELTEGGFYLVHPAGLEPELGFSHGALLPNRPGYSRLITGGQNGHDERGVVVSDRLPDQVAKALDNALAVVAEVGGDPSSVYHMRIFALHRGDYIKARRELRKIWKERFGTLPYPEMALYLVSGFYDHQALVEIEIEAFIPPQRPVFLDEDLAEGIGPISF